MNVRPNSLGVVSIQTQYDNPDDFKARQAELAHTVKDDYLIMAVDGNEIPDLTASLNHGIQKCIEAGVEYIHWCHNDFKYTDPHWFNRLRDFLIDYPTALKVCASNSRDEIHPLRIGQEQSWLMRAADFLKYPWMWFDERFLRCGGCEDYAQHLNILSRGYFVVITPSTSIYHKGAQTRGKYDTDPHQRHNQHLFGVLTGFGGLVEVHQAEYWGYALDELHYEFQLEKACFTLGSLVKDIAPFQCDMPVAFLDNIFPQCAQARAVLQAQQAANNRRP